MPFDIQNIAFMLGNRPPERWPAIAEAHLVIKDRTLRISLASDGTVSIPETVIDPTARPAIAWQFREQTSAQLAAAWPRLSAAEGRCGPSPLASVAGC